MRSQRHDPISVGSEEWVCGDKQCSSTSLGERCKSNLQLLVISNVHNLDWLTNGARCFLDFLRLGFSLLIVRIYKDAKDTRTRYYLVQ